MVDVPFVVLDSIAIFLVVVPMPWHIAAWNSATCYMMIWTVIGCIIYLVDSIIWYGKLHNPAPVWCDIASKLLVGLSVAIPLSSLCINRRLYNIARMQTVNIDKKMKRRNVIIDTILAVVCPIIFMAIHYTQQGHRFDIYEDYGCGPTTYLTALGYTFVIIPPILVCAVSFVYCVLSIRIFLKRRHEFNEMLRSTSSGLTSHRYFRLMALAGTEIIIGLPTSLYFMIVNLKNYGVRPWISWEDTHWGFSKVVFWPAYIYRASPSIKVGFEINRWALPFIAFIFFAFFGLAEDARSNYRRAFNVLLRKLGVKTSETGATGTNGSSFGSNAFKRTFARSHSQPDAVVLPQYSSSGCTSEKQISGRRSLDTFLDTPDLDTAAFDTLASEPTLSKIPSNRDV
ncbi:STE3-domain-containing protein [Auricularia subglabra TFB-10046 SS5]|nr:STE3-domain-containing protein [Auricularia subglabra TFB-10046 SS5]